MSEERNLLPNIILITDDDTKMKTLIKTQGKHAYKDPIQQEILCKSVNIMEYAFVSLTPRDKIDRSYRKAKESTLNAFVIFRNIRGITMYIDLICVSRAFKDSAYQLLNLIYIFSRENNIPEVSLHVLPDPKLVKYYLDYGFILTHTIMMPDNLTIKAHLMTKRMF